MQIECFSNQYKVRRLTEQDVDEIYQLLSKNTLYYEYCPPFVTRDSIRRDMTALPPGKDSKDKYYVGFYQDEKMIAVLDLIDGYPENDIAYIGFFMTDILEQDKGVGTAVVEGLCSYLTGQGCRSVRLAWVKGNPQAGHFWLKNGFMKLKETTSQAADEVILAERKLSNGKKTKEESVSDGR